jgi:VanZ family protein
MAVIFAFSSMEGSPWPANTSLSYFLERKGAHVTEYFILTLLSAFFFRTFYRRERPSRVLLLSGTFAFAYAALDELHQYFVPYRGAHISDVGIDTFGVCLALCTLIVARQLSRHLGRKPGARNGNPEPSRKPGESALRELPPKTSQARRKIV